MLIQERSLKRSKTFGGMFQYHAELILRGCCHVLCPGDSQSYIGDITRHFNRHDPRCCRCGWNYVAGTAGGPATNYGFSSNPTDAAGTITA